MQVSKPYVYYAMSKVADNLGAFKTARTILEKLNVCIYLRSKVMNFRHKKYQMNGWKTLK